MAVHKFALCFVCTNQWASGQQCMEVTKAIIPKWNVTRMKRKLTMTTFWEMTIESKLLNQFQWSWYHSFEKTMFYSMTSKYAIFPNIKVTNIESSAFWGTPIIYIPLNPLLKQTSPIFFQNLVKMTRFYNFFTRIVQVPGWLDFCQTEVCFKSVQWIIFENEIERV